MALAEQADLVVSLSLRDGLGVGLKRAQDRLDILRRNFGRTTSAVGGLGQKLYGLELLAGAAIGGTVKQFADFEEALATINTVANVSAEELEVVGESMRTLAMDTGISLGEISASYYDLVSAGVAAKDAQTVLGAATELAVGGLATTGQTVDLLTTALNAYGLKASAVTRVTDGFAQAIAAGKLTAADLATSFARVAPLAAASGIEIEELQASFAQLTAAGIPASEASTQMRAAIVALRKPSTELQKVQAKLGVDFGRVAKQKGLQVAYQQIAKAARELGVDEATLLGNQEALGFLFGVTGKNADRYRENLEAVRRASEGNGVATEQYLKRQQTFNRQMARFRETLRDLGIELGSAIAPALGRIATKITEIVRDNREDIRAFADNVAAVIDAVTTEEDIEKGLEDALGFLRQLPWDTIGAGLEITGRAAKLAVEAFNALPAPLQNALIAVVAANKLTGGLVSGFVGDLVGIGLRNLTTINAASVTVIGQTVTGAGTGAPTPGGTGGGRGGVLGGVGKVAGFLGPAALAIGSVIATVETFNAVTDQIKVAEEGVRGAIKEAGTLEAPEATQALANTLRRLRELSLPEQALLDNPLSEGRKLAVEGIVTLGKSIVADRDASTGQIRQGLAMIESAQRFANERGWPELSDRIDYQRRILEDRLKTQTTATEDTTRKIEMLDLGVTVNATTQLNVAEVGQKVQISGFGGRIKIQ